MLVETGREARYSRGRNNLKACAKESKLDRRGSTSRCQRQDQGAVQFTILFQREAMTANGEQKGTELCADRPGVDPCQVRGTSLTHSDLQLIPYRSDGLTVFSANSVFGRICLWSF